MDPNETQITLQVFAVQSMKKNHKYAQYQGPGTAKQNAARTNVICYTCVTSPSVCCVKDP